MKHSSCDRQQHIQIFAFGAGASVLALSCSQRLNAAPSFALLITALVAAIFLPVWMTYHSISVPDHLTQFHLARLESLRDHIPHTQSTPSLPQAPASDKSRSALGSRQSSSSIQVLIWASAQGWCRYRRLWPPLRRANFLCHCYSNVGWSIHIRPLPLMMSASPQI